ncbi:cilia and flagella-associated protein 47 isoform X4 [Hydra vulgaris]|uniref:Cilia and flagella-associated protein 47 isoform X4 n=1 Tax=Hydra vulgaris TaxID=6087 RepID=A0ABM4BJK0_HYDVU
MANKGIEIKPEKVEFRNAKPHVHYDMTICIKNIGSNSKHIKLIPPETKNFSMKSTITETTIPVGLNHKLLIEYFNEEDVNCSDKLEILVDNEPIDVMLLSFSPKPQLSLVSEVDFGILVADGKSVQKQINILNAGSKCGFFRIVQDLKSNFHIYPLQGTVYPGYSKSISIELICKSIGMVNEDVIVELESQTNHQVLLIKANIVLRSLQLLSYDDKIIDCLRFGYVYYGTDVVQTLWLYNNSPQESKFVAVIGPCDGEEMGVDITKKTICSFVDNFGENWRHEKSAFFSVSPCEGKLDPFQKRKLYFKFSPKYMQPLKGWKSIMRIPSREDFAMFIRISSVGVLQNPMENLNVELAMTGTALPVSLSIFPSQFINFDKCYIGNTSKVVITLNNNSPHLSANFSIKSSAHFNIEPSCGDIDINGTQEMVFYFIPKQMGNQRKKFLLDIIGFECEITDCQQILYKKIVNKTYLFCCTGIGLYQKFPKPLNATSLGSSLIDVVIDGEHQSSKTLQNTCKKSHKIKKNIFTDKKVNKNNTGGAEKVVNHTSVFNSMTNRSAALEYTEVLTPKELHNIRIEPMILNFGNICRLSSSTKEIIVKNNTEKIILIDFQLECKELRLNSPLSQLVPPNNTSKVELVLDSQKLGLFEKSIDYIINGHHKSHFLVQANIVKLKLKLSTDKLHLTSVNGAPVESGLRKLVTLINDQNIPAKFAWFIESTSKETFFKIMPAKGTVDAFSSMECEVVFYPSYSASFNEEFICKVENGNVLHLKCSAELGITSCSFVESRLLFGNIPLNLTTTRSVLLKNDGKNHAYFQVINPSPLEGILIYPRENAIPVGGFVKLQISFKPTAPQKFETLFEIDVLSGKLISLRFSGVVDTPSVDISVKSFNFSGVYGGSISKLPFEIINLAKSNAKIIFDLSVFKDFKITDAQENIKENNNFFEVLLRGEEKFNAFLEFHPDQVATYDFIIPCIVNDLDPMSIYFSSLYHKILKRVQGIALRQPLFISEKKLEFSLSSSYFEEDSNNKNDCIQVICLKNISNETIKWSLDISNQPLVKQSIFILGVGNSVMHLKSGEEFNLGISFKPTSNSISFYSTKIPILLHEDLVQVYSYIELNGKVLLPRLVFQPEFIHIPPVPLCQITSAEVDVLAYNYTRFCELSVYIPKIEFNGENFESLLSVELPNGSQIKKLHESETQVIKIIVKFVSAKPIFFSTQITLTDSNNSFSLPVTASADNCLLTCSNFLINNQCDFQIICKEGKKSNSGTSSLFVPCLSAIESAVAPSFSTSNTSLYTTAYQNSEPMGSSQFSDHSYSKISVSNGKNFIINNEVVEKECNIVQRWFSSQCWSFGSFPIYLPYTLRENLSVDVFIWRITNSSLEGKIRFMNVFDLIAHLYGKSIPGITVKVLLSLKKEEDLVKCIVEMYSKMLTFLSYQGAILSSIKPECFLNFSDFKRFKQLENCYESEKYHKSSDSFELLSKKSWASLLLQIYKMYVLFRISPQICKSSFPSDYPTLLGFNSDPNCSNIYSSSERVILSWLNHHYEQQRIKCWKIAPPSRWIVNFENDLVDGLVLASVIAAYAPFLVKTHIYKMYVQPSTTEQLHHNCLKIIEMLHILAIDYDIVAADFIKSSPISMLMLCVYLIQNLPLYLPKSTIEFETSLHSLATKHIKITNPSGKPLFYQALLFGDYSSQFQMPNGLKIQVPPKGFIELPVEYVSRFVHTCQCTLLLVGIRGETVFGSTLAFCLKGTVNSLSVSNHFKYVSPCYELLKIAVKVECPFPCNGIFKVFLVETGPVELDSKIACRQKKVLTNSYKKPKLNQGIKNQYFESKPINLESKKKLLQSAFWCASKSIYIKTGLDSSIELEFLPFEIGTRHCSLLFSNEKVGDFLYLIEAESTLPLPLGDPFINGPFRMTSAKAMQQSSGTLKEDNHIIYLHCDAGEECVAEINFDYLNSGKERALVVAARQRMTDEELRRRDVTGMTSYQTILSKVSLLQINRENYIQPLDILNINNLQKEFKVEVSSPFFSAPDKVVISTDSNNTSGLSSIKVPITLKPSIPGQYHCKVIFFSESDIRVYEVECTVKAKNSFVELEFITPTHECVIQNIPFVNHSDFDWNMRSEITGEGFFGPECLVVPSKTTSYYPLSFKPIYEGTINGCLKLCNISNGVENTFKLKGLGSQPHPVDVINIECIVNEPTLKVLELKNNLPFKMVFQTFSDLSIITGPLFVPVLSRQTVQVPIRVLALKRGYTEGVICFVYDVGSNTSVGTSRIRNESDSEEDYNCTAFMSSLSVQLASLTLLEKIARPYRIWFQLNINAFPGKAVKTLFASSNIFSSTDIEIFLNNPLDKDLNLNVVINGVGLNGITELILPSLESVTYHVKYSPISIGKQKASVIFQSDLCSEFWYELDLIAEEALPQKLPMIKCCLGCCKEASIHVENHYAYSVCYNVSCSNSKDFLLRGVDDKLCLPPSCTIEVHFIFTPSSIGHHQGIVVFQNEVIGNQTFILSGLGEAPELKYQFIHARYGESASTIIQFHNSFECNVSLEVQLQSENSDFSMLSKPYTGILCSSKSDIYIPISYSAQSMESSQCTCYIIPELIYEETEGEWFHDKMKFKWSYVVQGIPIIEPIKDSLAPALTCRAREKLEKKIFVLLIKESFISSRDKICQHSVFPVRIFDHIDSFNNEAQLSEDFDFKLEFDNKEIKEEIQRSVLITLEKKYIDCDYAVPNLVFKLVFFPSKPFCYLVHLAITSPKGGIWKYPFKFVSNEAVPDDVIMIRAVGLNKTAQVSFRLNSQAEVESEFTAHISTGSDKMFEVIPQAGVLPPINTEGVLFTLSYKPLYYGKEHKTKLTVQSKFMQWIYEVRGVTPEYQPPKVDAAIISHNKTQKSNKKKNFVIKNLKGFHTK